MFLLLMIQVLSTIFSLLSLLFLLATSTFFVLLLPLLFVTSRSLRSLSILGPFTIFLFSLFPLGSPFKVHLSMHELSLALHLLLEVSLSLLQLILRLVLVKLFLGKPLLDLLPVLVLPPPSIGFGEGRPINVTVCVSYIATRSSTGESEVRAKLRIVDILPLGFLLLLVFFFGVGTSKEPGCSYIKGAAYWICVTTLHFDGSLIINEIIESHLNVGAVI